jgi:putative transposase
VDPWRHRSGFVAEAIRRRLAQVGVQTLCSEPGSPRENGCVESFHSRLRDEFLAIEEFENLAAAKKQTRSDARTITDLRPHGPLGYVSPTEFAARCACFRSPTAYLRQHSGFTPPVPP